MPERIGRYRILQKLGEGGCGIVYLAEQETPIRRQVAVKLIKPGMDTRQVIARFEAERQTLALMQHSSIAKVLDAGATASGRSFFVMELVRGVRITEYCDRYFLSTKERLQLFVQVCQAIQHAHRKGIIHRDIKPSNILVTQQDGQAVPMVIDFGIAKATSGVSLTEKTLLTRGEQFVGTPAYMSPEQVERRRDIDASTDIYSLGVLLYELLTGNTPFEAEEMLEEGWESVRRNICEKEPQTPSTRLTALAPMELNRIAKARRADGFKLIETVRGDLDWVVMKCLEKEPGRRYASSSAIAEDIGRHLREEPVGARPVSNVYRLQRFVRRNRLLVGAVTGVFAALLIGLGMSTWFYAKERAARKEAREAEAKALAREQQALERERQAQRKLEYFRDSHVDRKFPPRNSPRDESGNRISPQLVSLPNQNLEDEAEASQGPAKGADSNFGFGRNASGGAAPISPVVPPGDGSLYADLAAWWWKWMMELPWEDDITGALHPVLDTEKFDADQGQERVAPYHFLASPFGTVHRECEISPGVQVFIGMLNVESSNLEDYPFWGETYEEQRAAAKSLADRIVDLYVEVNGVEVEDMEPFRVASPQIPFHAPSPWIYGEVGGHGTSTGDGYFLLLRPLSPGVHTIYYRGAFEFWEPRDAFTAYLPIEMTYVLRVRGR